MSQPERHRIRLPDVDFSRDNESEVYFLLDHPDGRSERFRFHDYDAIYRVPGLYEQIFYDRLKCDSPRILAKRLHEVVSGAGEQLSRQRVLDFGAGNGMMGEELSRYGVARLVGADISQAAEQATRRDRPGFYDAYYVADVIPPDAKLRQALQDWKFSCLTTVAALGYDDIPAEAFREVFNLVADDGWIAFNIKEGFLGATDGSGFARFVKDLIAGEYLQLHHLERYQHRLSIEGKPLHYCVVVGRKLQPLPPTSG